MATLLQDVAYGLRVLRKSPLLTAACVLTLALGIGATATIFSLINAVFLQPLPIADPASAMAVYRTLAPQTAGAGISEGLIGTSFPNYEDLARRSGAFEALSALGFGQFSIVGEGDPDLVPGSYVTVNHFDLLRLEPARGRLLQSEDDGRRVVVLAYDLWQSHFGGDPDIVGRTVRLNAESFEVVGVAPRGFTGLMTLGAAKLWVPVRWFGERYDLAGVNGLEHRGFRSFSIYGRLAAGQTVDAAQAEVDRIAASLEREHPEWNRDRGFRVMPIRESTIDPNQRSLFTSAGAILMGGVALVLLIACANVAALLLSFGRSRRKEIAMRLTLGADRRRLVRQLLTESALLAVLGATMGLLLASVLKPLLWSLRPPFLEADSLDLSNDPVILLFAVLTTTLTGLLFGVAPALQAARTDLVTATKEGAGAPVGASRTRVFLGQGLVVAQVALCLVALVAAGLFVLSLRNAFDIDPGFDHEQLVVASMDLDGSGYDREEGLLRLERIVDELTAFPGVERAAIAGSAPLTGTMAFRMFPVGAEDQVGPDGVYLDLMSVSDDYFETMGIRLLEGRPFDARDLADGAQVALVNQTLAQRYWPEGSAVGQQLQWPASEVPWTIVGVTADAKYQTLGEQPRPFFYRPLAQQWSGNVTLHVRSDRPAGVLAEVRKTVRTLEPDLPLADLMPVDLVLRRSLWAASLGATLLSSFGALALILASIGVYGLLNQTLLARRRELGIRAALGADRSRLMSGAMAQGMSPVAAGLVIGAFASAGLLRFSSALLFDLSATDPRVLATAAVALGLVAAIACAMPSWRAARVDPVRVLRSE